MEFVGPNQLFCEQNKMFLDLGNNSENILHHIVTFAPICVFVYLITAAATL